MNDEQSDPAGYTEALGEHATNPVQPRSSGHILTIYLPCEACGGYGTFDDDSKCEDCSGTGKSIQIKSEWTVSSCEARIKAQFEQWVRRRARQAIHEAEVEDGPEEASRQREAYQAAMGAGHYTWDGKHVRSARGDLPGIKYLVYLLLRRCHPTVTEEQVQGLFDDDARACGEALGWALGNSQSPVKKRKMRPGMNGTSGGKTMSQPVTLDG